VFLVGYFLCLGHYVAWLFSCVVVCFIGGWVGVVCMVILGFGCCLGYTDDSDCVLEREGAKVCCLFFRFVFVVFWFLHGYVEWVW